MMFILGLVLGIVAGAFAVAIFDFDVKIEYVTDKSANTPKSNWRDTRIGTKENWIALMQRLAKQYPNDEALQKLAHRFKENHTL
jgi:hypothetical protein